MLVGDRQYHRNGFEKSLARGAGIGSQIDLECKLDIFALLKKVLIVFIICA